MTSIATLFIVLINFTLIIEKVKCECSDIRIRPNYASLRAPEWREYNRVFRIMYSNGIFDQLAALHTRYFQVIHDYPQFLIWHRYFLYDFENKMRTINPNLTLPYWDAASDFDSPHDSIVFSSQAFGSNGLPENDYCLTDGFMAGITVDFPSRHCIKRDFQGPSFNTIHPWHSPLFITSLIQTSSNYDGFRQTLEHSLHNSIHYSIGGNEGDMSKHYSPTDSLFYLHHANIDRIYAKWQLSQPHHLEALDGFQRTDNGNIVAMTPEYELEGYWVKAGDVLRTLEEPLCYTYDDIVAQKPRLTSQVEQGIRQLPKRLLKKYFPKFFDQSSSDSEMDHDFSDMRSLRATFNQPLPAPLAIPAEFFANMGFNVTRALNIQQRILKFVSDINNQRRPE